MYLFCNTFLNKCDYSQNFPYLFFLLLIDCCAFTLYRLLSRLSSIKVMLVSINIYLIVRSTMINQLQDNFFSRERGSRLIRYINCIALCIIFAILGNIRNYFSNDRDLASRIAMCALAESWNRKKDITFTRN